MKGLFYAYVFASLGVGSEDRDEKLPLHYFYSCWRDGIAALFNGIPERARRGKYSDGRGTRHNQDPVRTET